MAWAWEGFSTSGSDVWRLLWTAVAHSRGSLQVPDHDTPALPLSSAHLAHISPNQLQHKSGLLLVVCQFSVLNSGGCPSPSLSSSLYLFFSHWFLKLLFFGLGFGIMGFNLPFCLFLVRSCSLFDLPQSQFCLSCVTAINNLSGHQSVSLSCNLKLRIASATLMKQENNLIKD